MKRILFICKERTSQYGISTGLLQSSRFIVDFLNSKKIHAKVAICKDANGIDKEVHLYKPDYVIIHAIWVTPLKLEELYKKYKCIKWHVQVHSKVPFLANEGNAIDWLYQYKQISPEIVISTNNQEASKELTYALNHPVIWLPNIYYKKNIHLEKRISNGFLDIGCFSAVRPMKNTLLQAIAALRFAEKNNKRLRFHVNSFRTEQQGDQVVKNLKALFKIYSGVHELIEHEWVEHDKFLKLVSQMELGMQLSLSETYNIVAADFVFAGVPIIVSGEIEWMSDNLKAHPSKIDLIIERMEDVYFKRPWIFKKLMQKDFSKYNYNAKKRWLSYLKN